MAKHFIVAGASGLVGTWALLQLSKQTDAHVVALVRKPGLLEKLGLQNHTHVSERVFDYENTADVQSIGSKKFPCDVFLCCLGSTIKAAGSQQAFKRIEHDYPIACLEALKSNAPDSCFAFVSSTGASPTAAFYFKNKYDVETKLRDSGLCYVIARPSLLVGQRSEFRIGERIAEPLAQIAFGFFDLVGLTNFKKIAALKPISAPAVAQALIHYSNLHQSVLLEGQDLIV